MVHGSYNNATAESLFQSQPIVLLGDSICHLSVYRLTTCSRCGPASGAVIVEWKSDSANTDRKAERINPISPSCSDSNDPWPSFPLFSFINTRSLLNWLLFSQRENKCFSLFKKKDPPVNLLLVRISMMNCNFVKTHLWISFKTRNERSLTTFWNVQTILNRENITSARERNIG